MSFVLIAVMYFVILVLFACYAWLQYREAKHYSEWCDKTEVEVKAVRELNVALEKRLKRLEDDLSPSVDIEPDFHVKEGK